MENIILDTDSYKASMYKQYPEGTTEVYSYLESRGGRYKHTLWFGLQMLLDKLAKPITKEQVDEANAFFTAHGEPFNLEGWMYIVNELGGKLPLEIRAAPEGLVIDTNNVLMTVKNTDKKCFWLTTWVETYLMRVWYPTTVATQSWTIKQIIGRFLDETSDDPRSEIAFKLHDFGSRGVSSSESAALGGAAHLVNFLGSDTVAGVYTMNKFYNNGQMSGFSIPAAEHSTITSWGRENEAEAYANMLKQFAKPGALVAVVSDSYDLDNAVSEIWGKQLREAVIASGATVVIRPDSGDPVKVAIETCRRLAEAFGYEENKKGYKVLKHTRVIYGDGINEDTIHGILQAAKNERFSATNFAFGMGGALLQQVNRDTQRFAYKCSSATVNNKAVDVFKDPKTDPGKRSKKGKLDLVYMQGRFQTVDGEGNFGSVLKTVFKNGEVLVRHSLEQVRQRSNSGL
jgi:nicotinamide phosphoribosyltransferase